MAAIWLRNGFWALVMIFGSCQQNDSDAAMDPSALEGRWKLTAAHISSGGPMYWVEVEDGEELHFYANGKFTSNRYPDCPQGTFNLQGQDLVLDFRCPELDQLTEHENKPFPYQVRFEKDVILLTPTNPICIEGCEYKYVLQH